MPRQQDILSDKQSESQPASSPGSLSTSRYADAQTDLPSSSNPSCYSADTQPEAITDAEEDADDILAFIAALDAASDTNTTGWTHANASVALKAKRSRLRSDPNAETHGSHFDFFSHFDPILRNHLRHAYDRRKRWSFTGDTQQDPSSDVAMALLPNVQSLVHVIEEAIVIPARESLPNVRSLVLAIEEAIDTPARESYGQVLRRNQREDMVRANRELEGIDRDFESTWKGVVESRIVAGSIMNSVVRR